MKNPYLQLLVDQRYGQGWQMAWEIPPEAQVLDVHAASVDVSLMESNNLIHCLVALKKAHSDLVGDEPSAQVLSIHVSEDNARRMLARLESIADPQIQLSIQSLPLEQ